MCRFLKVSEGRNERLMFCVSFCCMIVAATKLSSSYKGGGCGDRG